MKLSDVPHELKIFKIKMNNGDFYFVNGLELNKILLSNNNFILLPNKEGLNKSFIVNWQIDFEKTKKNVLENIGKLIKK